MNHLSWENEKNSNATEEIVQILLTARQQGSTVFMLGNGGSAATAEHFVCDLSKAAVSEGSRIRGIRAFSLTNSSMITAIGNDLDFTEVFEEQLKGYMKDGDIVVCISASGKSPNVVQAAQYAQSKGNIVIGLTGFDGGLLKDYSDIVIIAPFDDYALVEECHLATVHIITTKLSKLLA